MANRRRCSLLGFILILSLTACGGGGSGGSSPPAPTASATLSMSVTKTSARVGDSVTLTWSSANATSCTASGAWSGTQITSGSLTLPTSQTGASTYQLSCNGGGGSAQGSVTLTVVAAPTQVSVPGLLAPVPVASGPCVPGGDSDYQTTCISTEAGIPGKYATFSADLSGQVQLTGANPPTVQTGGSCSGGWNASTGQFQVNTSLGNDAIAFTGADITEVTFSSSFLASLGLSGSVTGLSALVIGDASNADHFQMIINETTSSGNVLIASGGTVSMSAGTTDLNLLQCIQVVSAPPPPPPPANLSCTDARGSGTNGLSFANQGLQWSTSTSAAAQANTTSFNWGVTYNDPSHTSGSYTGSLRVSLWAVPYNFQGSGRINGTLIASASPNFTGNGAKSTNQIFNGYTFSNIQSAVPGTNPAAGAYCTVMALEVYDPNPSTCTDSDHFCYVDWAQFPKTQTFQ